jgi:hypothetical protein
MQAEPAYADLDATHSVSNPDMELRPVVPESLDFHYLLLSKLRLSKPMLPLSTIRTIHSVCRGME